MASPKVSVIIPIYNATKVQLITSINSVIKQTYDNIELILINYKSNNEETIAQLNKYSNTVTLTYKEDHLRFIKLFNNLRNIGFSSSRNKGIEESIGEDICFLDQVDYNDPDYVAKLVEAIESEEVEIVMCGFYSLDESENIIDTSPKVGMDTTSPWYLWSICAIWNRIYKREFLQENNIRFPAGCVT